MDSSPATGKKSSFYYMLEEFSKYWDRIDIICPKANKPNTLILFGRVHMHSSTLPKLFQPFYSYYKGRELTKNIKYDLIDSHDGGLHPNGLISWLLGRKYKIPYISEILHVMGYPQSKSIKEKLVKIITKYYVYWAKNKALAFRVMSNQPAAIIEGWGVPKYKMIMLKSIYINKDIFHPVVCKKDYDVVFCGRFDVNKGINLILEAVIKIKVEFKNFKILLIGSGKYEKKVKNKIVEDELKNNVEIIKWVETDKDLADYFNRSKIVIVASYSEGGPRYAVEAMSCGVPPVATRVGVMAEIIEDGKNGFFVDWDSSDIAGKISILLRDEGLRKKMGEQCIKIADKYEYKKTIKELALGMQGLIH